MKKTILLLTVLFSLSISGQVGSLTNKKGKAFENASQIYDNFKNTTTLFILPDKYSKEEYNKVISEVWDVTPFEIINKNEMDYSQYANGKYSFAMFSVKTVTDHKNANAIYIFPKMGFFYLDVEKYQKALAKKKKKNKTIKAFKKNLVKVAYIPLTLRNKEYAGEIIKELIYTYDDSGVGTYGLDNNDVVKLIYAEKDIFTNFSLGFLKNYLQVVNAVIKNKTPRSYRTSEVKPELKNLKKQTLYIPEYVFYKYKSKKNTLKKIKQKDIDKMLSKYGYKTKIISQEELDKKILNNEKIYYMRTVYQAGMFTWVQVVDAQTGFPVYRKFYLTTIVFNVKPKFFKDINKAINKL